MERRKTSVQCFSLCISVSHCLFGIFVSPFVCVYLSLSSLSSSCSYFSAPDRVANNWPPESIGQTLITKEGTYFIQARNVGGRPVGVGQVSSFIVAFGKRLARVGVGKTSFHTHQPCLVYVIRWQQKDGKCIRYVEELETNYEHLPVFMKKEKHFHWAKWNIYFDYFYLFCCDTTWIVKLKCHHLINRGCNCYYSITRGLQYT